MEREICKKCNSEKDISDFSFKKDIKNFRNVCKLCMYERNKELKKLKFENYEWNDFPAELKCGCCNQIKTINYFPKQKDTELSIRKTCKQCKSIYNKEYYQNNYETLRNYFIDYPKKLHNSNPNFKLASNLRSRTGNAFRTQIVTKSNKIFDLLGFSHGILQNWIESQLYGDMTMQNYGSVWQIDHTLPISSFNLSNENEKRKCFFWCNLRPMYMR